MKRIIHLFSILLCLSTSDFFAQDGALDPNFGLLGSGFETGAQINGNVLASLVQEDGKIIVGGEFTTYNGVFSSGIIRLNTDGTVDKTFDVGHGANSRVRTISIQADGKIILGGDFTFFNGTSSRRLVRLNTDGSLDTTFNLGSGFTNSVYTTSIQEDGKILIGGGFGTFNGISSPRLVRLNTDGSLDTTFDVGAGFNNIVRSIALQADGKVIAGGIFTTYNGASSNRIVRLNIDGSLDTTFNNGEGFNGIANTIAIQEDGKILVGGTFTTYNGASSNRIIRLNADGSLDSSFNMGTGFDNVVWSTTIQNDGKIIIGGDFLNYNGVVLNRLVRLNTDGSLDTSFNVGVGIGTDNSVVTISVLSDNKIIIGGEFNGYNGVTLFRIALINADGSFTGEPAITSPGINAGVVLATAIQNDEKIIISGQFNSYNGTTSPGLVRINPDGSIDATFNVGTGVNGQVFTTAIQTDGKILVGGSFSTYNGIDSLRLIRLNSDGSIDTTFNIGSGFNGSIRTVSIQDNGKILVGGSFSTYNEIDSLRLIRLNSDGSIDTSFNVGLGFDGTIFTSHIQDDGKILVGGSFTSYDGISRNRLVRLNSDGSFDTTFNIDMGFDSTVNTMTVQVDEKIIIGGSFGAFNGTPSPRLVRLNSDGSLDMSFNTGDGFNSNVFTTALQEDGKVIVGGQFTFFNGVISPRMARLNPDGSLDRTFNVTTGFNNIVRTVQVQEDGNIIIGGQFITYNDITVNRITRLIGSTSFPPSNDGALANTLSFDGIGDFVNCGVDTAFDFTLGTIEAWIKPSSSTSDRVILANRTAANASQTRWSIHIDEFDNTMGVYDGTNFLTLNVGPINPDTWYHIAVIMNTSFTRVYVNGIDRGSMSIGINASSVGNPLLIGASSTINSFTNEYFEGAIDEIRIWSRALSVSEIQANSQSCGLTGSETDLVAYYNFNQGTSLGNNSSETILNDISGNGRQGNLIGFTLNGETSNWIDDSPVMPSNPVVSSSVVYNEDDTAIPLTAVVGANGTDLLWYTTATGGTGSVDAPTPDTSIIGDTSHWVSSVNDNGCESDRVEIVVTVNALIPATHLNFDGIDDLVDLGDTIESLGDFTFETWIYHASTGTQSFNEIFSKTNVNSLNIWRDGGSKVWFHLGNGSSFFDGGAVISNASIPFDQWTHIAVTWDESISTVSIYIDGTLDIQQVHTHSTGSFMGDSPFRRGIGGYPDGPVQNFEGSIDELRVWNRIRSVEEINEAMSCELQGNEMSLLAYYNFNQGSNGVDNSSETILIDVSSSNNDGTLTNFLLSGSQSNWVSGSPITFDCSTLSINEFNNLETVDVYPNPVSDLLNVRLQPNVNLENINIYSITGQHISTFDNAHVNTSSLIQGIYFVEIITDKGKVTKKIIKNQ